MRLIDADHLLFLLNSAIELRKKLNRNTSDLDMMVDAVNNEPTAYDLDKVVAELEKLADKANDKILEAGELQQYYDGYEDGLRLAIEFVKGGVGDEIQFTIEEQPTAYNLDKVLEQLKEVSYERYGNDGGMGGELVVNLDDVVDILKGGGVDG